MYLIKRDNLFRFSKVDESISHIALVLKSEGEIALKEAILQTKKAQFLHKTLRLLTLKSIGK